MISMRRQAEKWLASRPHGALSLEGKTQAEIGHEIALRDAAIEVQHERLRRLGASFEENRRRQRALYDRAPLPYLTLDRDGCVVDANPVLAALVGVERESLVGKPFTAMLAPNDAPVLAALLAQVLREGGTRTCEVTLGVRGPVELVATRITTRGRGACWCVLRDVREAKRALAMLREAEERFRLITENVEDVFYIVEQNGTLSYVSPAYEHIWLLPSADIQGRTGSWPNGVHRDDVVAVETAIAAMHRGDPFDIEYRIVDGHGTTRWIHDRAFPIHDDDGRLVRIIGLAHDCTAARELEAELRQAQKLEAIGGLAIGIAHDYNNVLQLVVSCATVALDERTPAEQAREMVARARDAALRGGELVHLLSGFARKADASSRAVALDRVVKKAMPLLRSALGTHIELVVETKAPGALVQGGESEILQILLNLASNARDAMPFGGTLTVRTERDAGTARLVVTDTGSGIDEATKAHMFDPFFTTKPPGRGTGLGLASVSSVTRRLGGRVTVESEPGKGASFVFELPVAPQPSAPGKPTTDPTRLVGSVLVVEDEPLVRSALRRQLTRLGLEVFEALDIEHAIELFARRRPDLLVTDVLMPNMTGPALAEKLRSERPDLPVLFMSGDPHGSLDVDSLPPRTRFLWKPFASADLAAEVKTLLGASESSLPDSRRPPSVPGPRRVRRPTPVPFAPSFRVTIRRLQANGTTSDFVIRGETAKMVARHVRSALQQAVDERGRGVWSNADLEVWLHDALIGRLAPGADPADLARIVLERLGEA